MILLCNGLNGSGGKSVKHKWSIKHDNDNMNRIKMIYTIAELKSNYTNDELILSIWLNPNLLNSQN